MTLGINWVNMSYLWQANAVAIAKDVTEIRPLIEPIFRTFCNRRRVHVRPLDIKIIGGRNG